MSTWTSATARWRALREEADRLWEERKQLSASGRYADAIEMSPRVQAALRRAAEAEREAKKERRAC